MIYLKGIARCEDCKVECDILLEHGSKRVFEQPKNWYINSMFSLCPVCNDKEINSDPGTKEI